MTPTPTDDIRAARRALAARLGNDIRLIAEEARRRQHESGRTYLSLPARSPQPEGTPNQPQPQTGAATFVTGSV
jgi:hypothetical protein